MVMVLAHCEGRTRDWRSTDSDQINWAVTFLCRQLWRQGQVFLQMSDLNYNLHYRICAIAKHHRNQILLLFEVDHLLAFFTCWKQDAVGKWYPHLWLQSAHGEGGSGYSETLHVEVGHTSYVQGWSRSDTSGLGPASFFHRPLYSSK